MAYLVYFQFVPQDGSLVFQSDNFFPVDEAGFGEPSTGVDGLLHNFHFTTELHTKFRYAGGESFTFIGDDDVWVFINGKLALDLGGAHDSLDETVDLDARAAELGLELGGIYGLELFHAERHTSGSNFRIQTSLSFVNCGEPPQVR
jgi:fibro-slime domain-containing protein